MPINTEEIRRLRLLRGLTMEQAAAAAKLSGRGAWGDIEAGRRPNLTVAVLERVAKALGVKARDLLT